MSNRPEVRQFTNHLENRSAKLSAAEEIERDRFAREQEIRERIDHEKLKREKENWEPRERDRTNDPHQSVDESGGDQMTFTLSSSKVPITPTVELEHERLERERAAREYYERDRFEQETDDGGIDASTSDGVVDDVSAGEERRQDSPSSAWARGRKRRRNWRNGDTV
jgi:hypothetical protein